KNYDGLPIERRKNGQLKWVTTKKSKIGQERLAWANRKADEYNIPIEPGYLAKVMRLIHPTKNKVCQICGETMSLYYIYPNKNFSRFLAKEFDYLPDTFDTIYDVIDKLVDENNSINELKKMLISKLDLSESYLENDIDEIIVIGEMKCREGNKSLHGPGGMSNFPDRYDGFHTYNKCCREKEDEGRHADNMKTYNKDRRAYENWSDGNIHAANKFMRTQFFKDATADHIGPISLGFVHDPKFIQPMSRRENSSKRDRLTLEDLRKLIEIEKNSEQQAISWFAADIWEFIKEQLEKGYKDVELWRSMLKTNIVLFMNFLWEIIMDSGEKGEKFIEKTIIAPKQKYFNYEYKFDHNGNIIKTVGRNHTDASRKEYGRFVKISFDVVKDFKEKGNRNIKASLPSDIQKSLILLINSIKEDADVNKTLKSFKDTQKKIQLYVIDSYN